MAAIGKAIALIVSAKAPRRRAGRAFGPVPVRIPVEALSEADVAAIRSDPALMVKLELPEPDKKTEGKGSSSPEGNGGDRTDAKAKSKEKAAAAA